MSYAKGGRVRRHVPLCQRLTCWAAGHSVTEKYFIFDDEGVLHEAGTICGRCGTQTQGKRWRR